MSTGVNCPKCGAELGYDEDNSCYVCYDCGAKFRDNSAKTTAVVPAAPAEKVKKKKEQSDEEDNGSYFDGGLAGLIGTNIVNFLLAFVTLSIGIPWCICRKQRWFAKHTFINGHQLQFTGTGASLVWQWIKWMLLSLITIGIYGLWVPIKLEKWTVSHTEFAD